MGIENPELLSDNGPMKNVTVNDLSGDVETVDAELTEVEDLENLDHRATGDGPGNTQAFGDLESFHPDNLPPSDFISYATEGVEKGTV